MEARMRQAAIDMINGKNPGIIPHTDYSMEYHLDYIAALTGTRPDSHNENQYAGAMARFYDAWDFDFLWRINNGLHGNWKTRGRATDLGHASYAADGSDQRQSATCPFHEVEEVWDFDPCREYGLPDFDAQVNAYQHEQDKMRAIFPNQLYTGGYYKTVISGAIDSFGWDMLLLAASDEEKFAAVLERFYEFTAHHMRAWAKTDAPVIIQHDDFVWSSGPFLNPAYYRRIIIPFYRRLWEPLHAAGKKVLFCSDGDFHMFAGDILDAGADGLIFEPMNDFEYMAREFGKNTCLVGSAVDCRDMTFGKWEQVRFDMEKTLRLAEKCRGYIFAVGNHIPANISDDMCDKYFSFYQEKIRKRAVCPA